MATVFLDELDNTVVRIEKINRKISDGAGGLVDIVIDMPIWIDPIAKGGFSNTKEAFALAKNLVECWMIDKPENPAPIIINISGNMPFYGESKTICQNETRKIVNEIMLLKNGDGNVLVFNVEIANINKKIMLPNSILKVRQAGEMTEFLFSISSILPNKYIKAADMNGLSIDEDSKGLVFIGNMKQFINLIIAANQPCLRCDYK